MWRCCNGNQSMTKNEERSKMPGACLATMLNDIRETERFYRASTQILARPKGAKTAASPAGYPERSACWYSSITTSSISTKKKDKEKEKERKKSTTTRPEGVLGSSRSSKWYCCEGACYCWSVPPLVQWSKLMIFPHAWGVNQTMSSTSA